MKQPISLCLLLLAVAAFAACGDRSGTTDEYGHVDGDPATEGDDHAHEDGDHAHEGDDHAHEEGVPANGHDHGERLDLGSAAAGPRRVKLAVFGEIQVGHEAVLDIDVTGGPVAALRSWIGVESAKGSLKAKFDGEDGAYHGHVEVPATLPDGSRIWVEVEFPDGTRSLASFALPR